MALALGFGGCALNSNGLPSGLPTPPGGGTLSFSRTTLVDGIQGRSYTIWIPTTGGSGTLTNCTISAGALPGGLGISFSADPPATSAVTFCKITGTITTAGPASISFTVLATDSASNTASQTFIIKVRPDFAVTTATAFLDGVIGRTYGNPAAPDLKTPQPVATSVSTTVGNAPLTVCAFTIAGNPGFNLTPAPSAGNSCDLSSGATALTAAGAFSVSLAATDSDLMDVFPGQTTKIVVPKATKTSAALSLTVRGALTMALTQTGNATPTASLFNAVSGRLYAQGAFAGAAPTYAATGGLTTGGNYLWCLVNALPPGFGTSPAVLPTCGATVSVAVATPVTVSSAAAGAASTTGFTLQVADAGNAAVSQGSATAGTNLTINAALSLAANFNNPMPDAVFGRTWGSGAGFVSLVYTATGGDGAYTFTPPPTAGAPVAGSLPTPIACVAAATTLTCSSAAITGTPGAYTNAPASVDDAGNSAVPGSAAAAQTATLNRSLTVRAEFTITTVAPFIQGVAGRTYGNPAPPDLKTPQPVATDVSATIGNAPLTACAFAVSPSNPGFNLTPAPTGGNTCDLSSGTTTLTTAGAFTVALTATDSPISDPVSTGNVVPAGTVSNSGAPLPLTVDPALTLTLTQATNATPNTALLLAVQGRSYGVIGGTPFFAGTGGLSGTVNYDWCISAGPLPAGFVTVPPISAACGTPTALATATSVGVTSAAAGAAGGPTAFTLQISDTGNAAVPVGTAAAATALTIAPPISFSLAPAPTGVAPNGVIPDGVVGRTYGTPLADLVFTASGGLANQAGIGLQGTQGGTLSANGISCTPTTPQVGASVTVTCNSGGGPVTTPAGAGRTLTMSFGDAGSAAVPAGSTATDTAGYTSYSNTIATALAIALQAGSPDPANVNAQAVVGRTYGDTAATCPGPTPCAPVVYEATNGLPPYSFVSTGTLLTNSNICAVQSATLTTLTCDSNSLAVTGTTGTLTVTVFDTANATTPAGSAPLTKTYTVNPAVSLSVTPDPALASSTAVVGRLYGAPAGGAFSSPTYTATGGLSLYTFVHSGTLEANTNIVCTDAATTVTCESGVAVTGTAPFPETEPFTLQVTDGGNLTTPADAVGDTLTKNFTINDVLAITTTALKNGLVNYTYFPSGPGVTLAATGGLGGNTWVAGGSVGGCSPSGSLPTGLALGAATGLLSGVPTVASTLTTDFTFDVCVEDTPNVTTPSGTDTHANYVVNVMDTFAVAAGPGTDTVEVFNTTSNTFFTSVALNPGDAPTGVAVTPDGRKLYVTLNGADDVAIIDTIDGTLTTLGGFANCIGPQGIAIGMPGGTPTAFVGCSNRRIAVIDTSTDTILSENIYGSAGATFYGVAVSPNDALVYVTDSANNEFAVLNASTAAEVAGSPFAAGVSTPHGVVVSADNARVYIAGNTSDNVIVFSTADNTTVVAGPISTGLGSAPEGLALTPSDAAVAHVFVTLIGTDRFAVINDSLATPALIGATIPLAAASVPFGVTIPPMLVVPATGVRVYIAEFGNDDIAIINDETTTPFGTNAASPIALTPVSTPSAVTHIPVPR